MHQILKAYSFLLLCLLPSLLAAQPLLGVSLGGAINTSYPEQGAVLSPDGEYLFFVRAKAPQNLGLADEDDIWVSQRKADGQWAKALNLGSPINSREADAIVGSGPAGSWLLLFSTGSGQAPRMALRRGRYWQWADSIRVPNLPDWRAVANCFLGAQADLLLFSARLEGGYGGLDLYASALQPDGSWGEALNLGANINTNKDEDKAVLAADGLTLYYESTRGRQGAVLMSRRPRYEAAWEPPKPLPLALPQASLDGPLLAIAGSGTYLITSLPDSNGSTSLYRMELPENFRPQPVCILRGQCTKPPQLELNLYNQWLGRSEARQLPLLADGRFCTLVPTGSSVLVGARAQGYYATPVVVGIPPETQDIDPSRGTTNLSPEYFQRDANLGGLQTRYASVREESARLQLQYEALLASLLKNTQETAVQKWPAADLLVYSNAYAMQLELPADREGEAGPYPSFDSLLHYTRSQLTSQEASAIAAELIGSWLGTKSPEDSRPWAQVAESLRLELTQALNKGAQVSDTWPSWLRQLMEQMNKELAPGLRQVLRTQWQADMNALLPVALSRYDKSLAVAAIESDMRRLILEQIQEEERKGVALPDVGTIVPAKSPALPAELWLDIPLVPLRTGARFELANTFFKVNTPLLIPEAYLELGHLLLWLQDHPATRIEIGCHTHGWLGYALASRLSTQRARAIADFLASKGVSRNRLVVQSYGKMIPLASNDTEEGRLLNQRVEITILAAQ